MALDNGYKDNKSRNAKDKELSVIKDEASDKSKQKYTEDVSYTMIEAESEEDRASWFIAQSIPQNEKDSKKKALEEIKTSKKNIKKGKKECRKLKQLTKKNEKNSPKNN